MFYPTLLKAFTNFEQHDLICKTKVGKNVNYSVVKREGDKPKTALKLIEILHILKTEKQKFDPSSEARLKEIVSHMTAQKITHSKSCVLIKCIRNFFSKLQNMFNGYGFKTSIKMGEEFSKDLQIQASLASNQEQQQSPPVQINTENNTPKQEQQLPSPIQINTENSAPPPVQINALIEEQQQSQIVEKNEVEPGKQQEQLPAIQINAPIEEQQQPQSAQKNEVEPGKQQEQQPSPIQINAAIEEQQQPQSIQKNEAELKKQQEQQPSPIQINAQIEEQQQPQSIQKNEAELEKQSVQINAENNAPKQEQSLAQNSTPNKDVIITKPQPQLTPEGAKLQNPLIAQILKILPKDLYTSEQLQDKNVREHLMIRLFNLRDRTEFPDNHLSLENVVTCARLLKELGTDINYTSQMGSTILSMALDHFKFCNPKPTDKEQYDVIRQLVELQAKPDERVCIIVMRQCHNDDIIKLLLKDVNLQEEPYKYIEGLTDHVQAFIAQKKAAELQVPVPQGVKKDPPSQDEIIREIVSLVGKPRYNESSLKTAGHRNDLLLYLFDYGNPIIGGQMSLANIMKCVERLKTLGTDISYRDPIGTTVLSKAVYVMGILKAPTKQQLEIINRLIELGAKPELAYYSVARECHNAEVVALMFKDINKAEVDKLELQLEDRLFTPAAREFIAKRNANPTAKAETIQPEVSEKEKNIEKIKSLIPQPLLYGDLNNLRSQYKLLHGLARLVYDGLDFEKALECIQCLIKLGLDINKPEKYPLLCEMIYHLYRYNPKDKANLKKIENLIGMGCDPKNHEVRAKAIEYCHEREVLKLIFSDLKPVDLKEWWDYATKMGAHSALEMLREKFDKFQIPLPQ